MRDFFAALWVVRRGGREERKWLARRVCIRDACYSAVYPEYSKNLNRYEHWRFVVEAPTEALAKRPRGYIKACQRLFRRRQQPRPNELLYRCWPRLLRLSSFLSSPEYSEEDLATATQAAQRAASQDSDASTTRKNPAKAVVVEWLREYKRTLESSTSEQRRIANEFENGFRRIPRAGAELRFWYGYDKQSRTIPAVFHMAQYPATNELMGLYDGRHGELKNAAARDSDPRWPVRYLNWYDAWALATWLHSRLPSDVEWEYACRARPGLAGVPHHRWCFGTDEERLREFARFGSHTPLPVGPPRSPNEFGLYDVHGNVWEWCEEPSRRPDDDDWRDARVLRGGSFDGDASVTCSSAQYADDPSNADYFMGVRFARSEWRTASPATHGSSAPDDSAGVD